MTPQYLISPFPFPGSEVDWVQCDGGCNKWFHMYCVGLNKSQIKPEDDYICNACQLQGSDDDGEAQSSPSHHFSASSTRSPHPASQNALHCASQQPAAPPTAKAKKTKSIGNSFKENAAF